MDAAGERLSSLGAYVGESGTTRLRPIRRSDADDLFPEVHGRHSVTQWLCWEGPADLAEMRDRYQSWHRGLASEPLLIFAIEEARDEESSPAAIGELTLRFDGHPGIGDLGYWLGEVHHGQGHGSRALSLAVEFAFEQLDARVLTASVKEGNRASVAMLEAEGFHLEPAPGREAQGGAGESGGKAARPGPSIAWYASLTRRAWARIKAR